MTSFGLAKPARLAAAMLFSLGLSLVSSTALAQNNPTASPGLIDPKADALLKQMSAAIAGAKELTLDSTVTMDEVTPTGQKIQYTRKSKVAIRRPGAARAETIGDRENYLFIYDGKTVNFIDQAKNNVASAPAPGTIDATMDMLAEKYGIVAPLADLLFSNPYDALTSRVQAGVYVGEHFAGGNTTQRCDHLAFRCDSVDFQVWLDKGEKPLPRKIVITYKTMPGEPEFIAFIDNWNLSPKLSDDTFKLSLPADAKQVPLNPLPPPTTQP